MSDNGRQVEGWALDRLVWARGRHNLVWGFFETKSAAEAEATRLTTRKLKIGIVPATLILPAHAAPDGGGEKG